MSVQGEAPLTYPVGGLVLRTVCSLGFPDSVYVSRVK